MIMRETIGPTPNGGVRSAAYFTNDRDEPVDESVATKVRIVEYGADGPPGFRTYGTINPIGGLMDPTNEEIAGRLRLIAAVRTEIRGVRNEIVQVHEDSVE